jgi:hypothetical protein
MAFLTSSGDEEKTLKGKKEVREVQEHHALSYYYLRANLLPGSRVKDRYPVVY